MERRQQKAARKQERKSTEGTGPEIAEMPEDPETDDLLEKFDAEVELNPAGGLSRVRPDDAAEPRR